MPSLDNVGFRPAGAVYPSTAKLQKGDILLFSPIKPTEVQRRIQRQQRRWGSPDQHSQFTHAAIYLGQDHLLCESVPFDGVRHGALESRLADNCILARRFPNLTDVERDNIQRGTQQWLETAYGYTSAFLALLHPRLAAYWDEHVAQELVCSRLCDRVITAALVETRPADTVRLHNNAWITPANLSESRILEDVDLKWQSST